MVSAAGLDASGFPLGPSDECDRLRKLVPGQRFSIRLPPKLVGLGFRVSGFMALLHDSRFAMAVKVRRLRC